MEERTEETQNSPSRLLVTLESHRKTILTSLFLITLGLTISPSSRDDSYKLLETSINNWTTALRTIGDAITTNLFQLANLGIERFILFLQEMYDFYFDNLLLLDFAVFRQTGYVLAGIYLVTPLIIIYLIVRAFFYIKSFSIRSDLTPKLLAVILLLIPFPTDFTWLGAGLLIPILIYWLYTEIQEELITRKGTTLLEILPWKKTILLAFSLLILLISVIDSNFTNVIATMVNLEPTLIMVALIVGLIGILILWIIIYASVTQSDVSEVFTEKLREIFSPVKLLLLILLIIFSIPLLDAIIIQGVISQSVFVVINFPWLLVIIFFEPFAFFDYALIILRDTFDVFLDASREIFRGILPVQISDNSIIGVIQPTMILTLFTYFVILILYMLMLYVLDSSDSNKRYRVGETRVVQYRSYITLTIITGVTAFITLYLDPNTFIDLYGDPYALNWKKDPLLKVLFPLIPLFLMAMVGGIILLAIYWGILQIRKGRSPRIITSTLIINALAVVIAIIMIVPFVWMIKNSIQMNLQNTVDFQSQGLLPDPFTTRNYAQIFGVYQPTYANLEYRVVTWLFNSVIAAGVVTVFLVIFSAMAGYVLAKREFVGRRLLFTLTIAIQMVPPYVQVIPLYLELDRIGLGPHPGSLLGVILPFLIQPFSIFLCTEFMRGIPDDYLDAARIDGYSEFQIFRKIVLPLSIPVLSVMFIINIIGNWNSFMWPLLLLEASPEYLSLRTLPLGMYNINSHLEEQVGVILALATIIVIPIFIILFLAQDYIKRGVSVEGLKG